ncbi:MAG: imidazolonepropionase [Candidatus Eremiobacteraeota bacterium]|nr:imidazolonepropionase [Candidatus Eremiobacteraeota bacterium]MBC5803579.1 imidazolonepropionase [Candidatus Eremiobacteraeota bacterium]MBC5822658.1 imidazolonepropionase [Candidatus Eremiobacteraeota bacterium]
MHYRDQRHESGSPQYDALWTNARIATMLTGTVPYGALEGAALAAKDGAIAWLGVQSDLPDAPERLAVRVIDVGGRWITPGLIDSHTHLIFGGERVADFERRVGGERYAAAAAGGSGIAYTVARTRACDEATLFRDALRRLRTHVANGTTTIEIKSGYGLDVETELRMLRVARRLDAESGISVRTTYLGAHVVPPEYAERREAYLDLVCDVMLPRIANERLADAVDVFCDTIAFSPPEAARVLATARALGLAVKVHADQIADTGAAALAARYGALSADHLERTDEHGVLALAAAGTVGVVLPGAYYFLRETVKPPLEALRRHGVPLALATDCNPGTSPLLGLPTAMNLACVLFGLSPEEALAGVTRNAARALGLADRGLLAVGKRCDLALWDVGSPAEIAYWLGGTCCAGVVVAGKCRAADRSID